METWEWDYQNKHMTWKHQNMGMSKYRYGNMEHGNGNTRMNPSESIRGNTGIELLQHGNTGMRMRLISLDPKYCCNYLSTATCYAAQTSAILLLFGGAIQ